MDSSEDNEPVIESIDESGNEITAADEPIVNEPDEFDDDPVVGSADEFDDDPVVGSADEFDDDPVVEPVVEPMVEPMVEPVIEPTVEPTVDIRACEHDEIIGRRTDEHDGEVYRPDDNSITDTYRLAENNTGDIDNSSVVDSAATKSAEETSSRVVRTLVEDVSGPVKLPTNARIAKNGDDFGVRRLSQSTAAMTTPAAMTMPATMASSAAMALPAATPIDPSTIPRYDWESLGQELGMAIGAMRGRLAPYVVRPSDPEVIAITLIIVASLFNGICVPILLLTALSFTLIFGRYVPQQFPLANQIITASKRAIGIMFVRILHWHYGCMSPMQLARMREAGRPHAYEAYMKWEADGRPS